MTLQEPEISKIHEFRNVLARPSEVGQDLAGRNCPMRQTKLDSLCLLAMRRVACHWSVWDYCDALVLASILDIGLHALCLLSSLKVNCMQASVLFFLLVITWRLSKSRTTSRGRLVHHGSSKPQDGREARVCSLGIAQRLCLTRRPHLSTSLHGGAADTQSYTATGGVRAPKEQDAARVLGIRLESCATGHSPRTSFQDAPAAEGIRHAVRDSEKMIVASIVMIPCAAASLLQQALSCPLGVPFHFILTHVAFGSDYQRPVPLPTIACLLACVQQGKNPLLAMRGTSISQSIESSLRRRGRTHTHTHKQRNAWHWRPVPKTLARDERSKRHLEMMLSGTCPAMCPPHSSLVNLLLATDLGSLRSATVLRSSLAERKWGASCDDGSESTLQLTAGQVGSPVKG